MSKNIKRVIKTSVIIILILVIIISTFFIVRYFIQKNKDKEDVEYVTEVYSEDDTQETDNINELLQINDETAIAVIKIEKINFEGLVYEGTELTTLAKGVGHISSSPYLNRKCMSCST